MSRWTGAQDWRVSRAAGAGAGAASAARERVSVRRAWGSMVDGWVGRWGEVRCGR